MNSLQKTSLNVPPLSGIERVWRLTKGDPRVVIAVIDGSVDTQHPCFKGASLQVIPLGWDGNGANCQSHLAGSCTHGTQIASLIFGQHGTGEMLGIAPRCTGIIIPIFNDDPLSPGRVLPASQSTLAEAINLARENGAHIINISAGERSSNGQPNALLSVAIQRCVESGILIISAAGNDGCNCLHVPAAMPDVLTVGALNVAGNPAKFSNFGDLYRHNGLLAPGENLAVAIPGGDYTTQSGTSFATPLVAGVAGLLLSLEQDKNLNKNSRLNALPIRNLLLQSAQPCTQANPNVCLRYLGGVLDCNSALNRLIQGETPMTDLTTPIVSEQTSPLGTFPAGLEPAAASEAETIIAPYPLDAWQSYTPASATEPLSVSHNFEAPFMTVKPHQPQYTSRSAGQVSPSSANGECGCQKNTASNNSIQLVYALGTISYDFGTQARFDAIAADIGTGNTGTLLTPSISTFELLEYLDKRPYAAASIIWTLNLDAMPLYAIRAEGAFATHVYGLLRQFLNDQVDAEQRAERVSIPGYIEGSVRLSSGQVIPVLVPEIRGMYNWTTKAFIDACVGKHEDTEKHRIKMEGISNFLDRVYYEIRNLGMESRDRALNFAATNAFQIERIFEKAVNSGLQLDQIEVTRSPVCRSDSDCWDVVLYFFNPKKVLEEARRAYRFTADVSDIVPVLIGEIREWSVR